MAVFMIERRFAEQLELTAEDADGVNQINDDEGVQWLYSFLSADKHKTFCLYETPARRRSTGPPSGRGFPRT